LAFFIRQLRVDIQEIDTFVVRHVCTPSLFIIYTASHPAYGRVAFRYLSFT